MFNDNNAEVVGFLQPSQLVAFFLIIAVSLLSTGIGWASESPSSPAGTQESEIQQDLAAADEDNQAEEGNQEEGNQEEGNQVVARSNLRLRSEEEIQCLALNIYFEARGEPAEGQRAVGHVVMNRVDHSRYPSTVCEVIKQGGEQRLHKCQFSWWCDGRSDSPTDKVAWDRSLRLAKKIYAGLLEDITDGALWYHAEYVTPYWSKVLLQGDRIGQHIFYLERGVLDRTL